MRCIIFRFGRGGHQRKGKDLRLLAGKPYVGFRDAPNGFLRRLLAHRLLQDYEQTAATLVGKGGLEGRRDWRNIGTARWEPDLRRQPSFGSPAC